MSGTNNESIALKMQCDCCGHTLNYKASQIGDIVDCSKCEMPTKLRDPKPLPVAFSSARPKPPNVPKTKSVKTPTVTVPVWSIWVLQAIVLLGIGYFAGRKHFQYQIERTFSQIAEGFAAGMENIESDR
jgi:hypothetical protein